MSESSVSAATIRSWASHLRVPPESVDPAALRRELSAGTLVSVFLATAAAHPDAVIKIDDGAVTHRELAERAARVATVLRHEGVGPGARVIVCLDTSLDFLACYLGVLWVNATVVLANPSYTPAELHKLCHRSAAQLLISAEPSQAPIRHLGRGELVARAETAEPTAAVPGSCDDIALLAFTSGTTGVAKGVPLTHGNVLASIRGAMWAWDWSARDTLIHALPLYHQHGLSGIHAALIAGSTTVVLKKFDPRRLIDRAVAESATVMFAVPSIHQRLLELPEDALAPLRRLRLITSGSAPLSPALERAFAERIGVELLQRYGLTESGLDVSNPWVGARQTGSVGHALPGVEIALFDADGTRSAPGSDGEICLRGPQVFAGYLDDRASTDAAFWPGDWFRSGDLGHWDGDRLVISGRSKELIISGGMNIAPREVELALEQHPSIAEAAVAGTPSERWGEQVAAWVVLKEGASVTEEDLIAHCRTQLAAYKCPKQVYEVSELPRNALGKILRGELARRPS